MTHDSTTNGTRKRRGRPFPWRCFNCLKEEVYPATIPYAADIKHDGRLHHIEVPKLTIPTCRACGEVVFNYSADDQMLQALRSQLKLLTPRQIKEGRKALGLQSKELAERLGVAKETVSRWETGMMIQSRAMDNLLRVYFAVPEVRAVLRGTEQDVALGTLAVANLKGERRAKEPTVKPLEAKGGAMSRKARVLPVLASQRVIRRGTEIELNPDVRPTDADTMDPRLFRARIENPEGLDQSIRWLFDDHLYSLSELTRVLKDQHGANPNVARYFANWRRVGAAESLWDEAERYPR